MRTIFEAPARAIEDAMAPPMPEPPPVMIMVLLARESEGWVGVMAG